MATAAAKLKARAAVKRRHSAPASGMVLSGVCAMVDVRVGPDGQINCSDVVARKLQELGAGIGKRLARKLTHIVVSHFTPEWKDKIAKWQAGNPGHQLQIVSQLWVNACYVSKQHMDEAPFFPVAKLLNGAVEVKNPAIATSASTFTATGTPAKSIAAASAGSISASVLQSTTMTTAPTPTLYTFGMNSAPKATRKRRAQSMEPTASDDMVRMLKRQRLHSPEMDKSKDIVSDASQPTPMPSPVIQSAGNKRRKPLGAVGRRNTIAALPDIKNPLGSTRDASIIDCVSDSDQDDEQHSKPLSERSPGLAQSGSTDPATDTVSQSSEAQTTQSQIPEVTPRKPLLNGAWECEACTCENPRTRRLCRSCRTPKTVIKKAGTSTKATTISAMGTQSSSGPARTRLGLTTTTTRRLTRQQSAITAAASSAIKTPAKSTATASSATPRLTSILSARKPTVSTFTTPARTRTGLTSTVPSARKTVATPATTTKTPLQLAVSHRRTQQSQKATGSNASESTRPKTPATITVNLAKTFLNGMGGGKRISLAPVALKTPGRLNASRKRAVQAQKVASLAASSEATPAKSSSKSGSKVKLVPTAATQVRIERSNSINTPPVKRQRTTPTPASREKITNNLFADEKFGASQSSISTPQPLRSSQSLGTPASLQKSLPNKRCVIGITGVDSEARGVLECAVHAIDANVSSNEGHRKTRVVKSLDYASGVTHLVVAKDTKRTIKVLFAIARGAWVVSEEWVLKSLENERWLPEAEFEVDMYANKYSRTHPDERQIFKGIKFFVGSSVDPSRETLQSLIQCAGGEICNQISVSDMCICGDVSLYRRAQRTGIKVVTPKWIFDSIASMKLEESSNYSLPVTPMKRVNAVLAPAAEIENLIMTPS